MAASPRRPSPHRFRAGAFRRRSDTQAGRDGETEPEPPHLAPGRPVRPPSPPSLPCGFLPVSFSSRRTRPGSNGRCPRRQSVLGPVVFRSCSAADSKSERSEIYVTVADLCLACRRKQRRLYIGWNSPRYLGKVSDCNQIIPDDGHPALAFIEVDAVQSHITTDKFGMFDSKPD